MKGIFTDIFESNGWHMGQDDSKSGLGSSAIYTESIRKNLVELVNDLQIKNIIDTSCGDWFWMKMIRDKLPCHYLGIDIVKDIINENDKKYGNDNTLFLCADFLSVLKSLPDKSVDLILCRHTCEHLPTEYNIMFIEEAKRVSKYLLLTTKTTDEASPINTDLILGERNYRPINLFLPPYNLVLNDYYVKKIYDGPSNQFDPEMHIVLYKF